jgi:hypothetical protein
MTLMLQRRVALAFAMRQATMGFLVEHFIKVGGELGVHHGLVELFRSEGGLSASVSLSP